MKSFVLQGNEPRFRGCLACSLSCLATFWWNRFQFRSRGSENGGFCWSRRDRILADNIGGVNIAFNQNLRCHSPHLRFPLSPNIPHLPKLTSTQLCIANLTLKCAD